MTRTWISHMYMAGALIAFLYIFGKRLRLQRTKKLIEKTKEQSAKKKKELEEALEKKREEKANEICAADSAQQLLDDKMSVSKDGKIYLYDKEIQTVIAAAQKAHRSEAGKNGLNAAGAYLDMKI